MEELNNGFQENIILEIHTSTTNHIIEINEAEDYSKTDFGRIRTISHLNKLIRDIKNYIQRFKSTDVKHSFYFDNIKFEIPDENGNVNKQKADMIFQIRVSNHPGNAKRVLRGYLSKSFITNDDNSVLDDDSRYKKSNEFLFRFPEDKINYKNNKDIKIEDIIYDISGYQKIKKQK